MRLHFYLIAIYLLFSETIAATHIIGGTITVAHLGNQQYKITLEVLRDCLLSEPTAVFDDPASIAVYNKIGLLFGNYLVPFMGDDTVSFDNDCVFSPHICVHKAIYELEVFLPVLDEGFIIAYQRCCRSNAILNLLNPLNTGMTFQTQVEPANPNSTPVFNKDFPFAVFANTAFSYDGSASDIDGDSLVYELENPSAGADLVNNMPQPPPPPPYTSAMFKPPYTVDNMLGGTHALTLDPVTGEMTAIPSTTGFFQIAYAVKEYRNEILIGTIHREFAFAVINSPPELNFDVSGSVLINGSTPLDLGKVQLLRRDITNDSLFLYNEVAIGPEASYAFDDIPPGVFYIKAIVDTASIYYDNVIPTYFPNSAFWYNANPINQCDTSQENRDIHLVVVDSLGGSIILEGFVTLAGRSVAPVPGLDLILVDANQQPVQARTTDNAGYFKFENLTPATYFLFVDLLNSPIDNTNPPRIELTSSMSVPVFLYPDSLSLQMPTSLESQNVMQSPLLHLHPTIAKEEIELSVTSNLNSNVHYILSDIHGRPYIQGVVTNDQPERIQISHIPVGIYIISYQESKSAGVILFVKQ